MQVTNNSKASQGVYSVDGLVFIEPGATKEIEIAPDYLGRAKSLPFLAIGETHPADDTLSPILTGDGSGVASDPLDHDGDGEKGGAHAPTGEGYDALIRLSVGTLNAANISKNLLITGLTQTVATVMPLNGVALVAEGPITGCTVTVVGKKSWVPTSGHTNEYFTWEKGHADLTKYELFTDVKVAMADISLPASGNATVNFDLPGLARTLGTSATLTSPTAETTSTVLASVQGKVLVGGTATSITGAQIQINGNIQPGEAEVGSNAISDHQRGRVTVTGSFTAKFSSTTLQTIFADQTATSLVLVVADSASATAEFVTFVMTNIKLFSDTADDGEKEIIRTYSFTAAIDGAGGAALANNQTIISIQDSLAA